MHTGVPSTVEVKRAALTFMLEALLSDSCTLDLKLRHVVTAEGKGALQTHRLYVGSGGSRLCFLIGREEVVSPT